MQPVFFSSPSQFRKWLEKNHDKKLELFVGYYKVGSGKKSMTWSESVDQALCFGWIDGVRKSIDEERYFIRFTPRKPLSTWSVVNIKKVTTLKKLGLMHPSGLASFKKRQDARSGIYSHEQKTIEPFSPDFEKKFTSNKKAWKFFTSQAPSYQRMITHWVMAAKQEKTRITRLEKVIKSSAEEKKLL